MEKLPAIYGSNDVLFDYSFKLMEQADFSIYRTADGEYDIGVGPVKPWEHSQIYSPRYFTAEELNHFWEKQKHKDFIVVYFFKSGDSDEELLAQAKAVQAYFFKLGFKRVRVHQAYSFGVGVWCDDRNPALSTQN